MLGTAELVGTSRNEELALLGMRTDVSLMSVMVQDVLSMYGFLVAVALQDGMLVGGVFLTLGPANVKMTDISSLRHLESQHLCDRLTYTRVAGINRFGLGL